MGMMNDAGNGLVLLFRFALFMVVLTICGLGMMYLPLAILGIDKVDEWWKAMFCLGGVFGYIKSLAYLGRK